LANDEHRDEKATDWQASASLEARQGAPHYYFWLESYMKWLAGKEARAEYHALLEQELANLRG